MHATRALRRLERLLRPHVTLFGRTIPAFHLCGYIGLGLMAAVMCVAASVTGASIPTTLVLIVLSAATFLASAMASKILTGVEQVVYYRNQILILAVAALALRLAARPLLPHLDILILGLGAFTACGRIGCLMVGCCHGRPVQRGICYRDVHGDAGFPRALVGVPLAPIQIIESIWIVCIVAAGLGILAGGAYEPGEVLTWYTMTYGAGRFIFELVRGDPERPYLLGLSEAQWTAMLTASAAGAAEIAHLLPFHAWHLLAMGGMLLASAAIVIHHTWSSSPVELLEPSHVVELARALRALDAESSSRGDQRTGWASIPMRTTSRGLTISASRVERGAGHTCHYAFSFRDGLRGSRPAAVARMLVLLCRRSGEVEIMEGNGGIYHLFIHSGTAAGGREAA